MALLLVLGLMSLTLVSALALLRESGQRRLAQVIHRDLQVADDTARHLERVIEQWLTVESSSVVLPWDIEQPQVKVLDESLAVDARVHRVRILAFDQCGMMPVSLATRVPWRALMPSGFHRALEELSGISLPLGLELLVPESGRPSPFPSAEWTDPTWFGDAELPLRKGEEVPPTPAPIGARVASHNPRLELNVHTAPAPLVELAFRILGRGGLELVEAARETGKKSVLGDQGPGNEQEWTEGLRLRGESSSWAFRVDVEVASVTRSWWLVYLQDASGWRCVQRLLIPL